MLCNVNSIKYQTNIFLCSSFRKVQGDGEEVNLEREFRKKYDSAGQKKKHELKGWFDLANDTDRQTHYDRKS